jgi:inosine-uridine nucleoside N-ribohydrolase
VQLVVDTDTGIDDALALMLLASVPEVDLVAVTTTHGNCRTEQSTANARRVLAACGLGQVPVIGGLPGPLTGELSVAAIVHGEDGLGDCGEAPPPAPPAPSDANAVHELLRLADRRAGELHLLALGPLTNLGAAVRLDPGVLDAFTGVTVMGGAGPRLAPGAPDPTLGVGDPNTCHDPEATRLVVGAASRLCLVGVDVTMGVAAGPAHLARLQAATTGHGRLAARITAFYVDFYERTYGRRALTLHDPVAAAVAVGLPIGASFVAGRAVVEGEPGAERCVLAPAEPGARPTRALEACDAAAVSELVTSALEGPLPVR